MKRWILLSILFLAILAIAAVYILIPPTTSINKSVDINSTPHATNRMFADKSNLLKWWPKGEDSAIKQNPDSLIHDGFVFKIRSRFYNGLIIEIASGGFVTNSTMTVSPQDGNTILINWATVLRSGSNPLRRLRYNVMQADLSEAMDEILNSLRDYLGKTMNIYGIEIQEQKVKDTLLVTTSAILKDPNNLPEIYLMINKLRTHLSKYGAKETNAPMLNLYKTGDDGNETMVAIPVDKEVPQAPGIHFKRMIDGNILVTEVHGGPYTVNKAFIELENYVSDYRMVSPAIPFISMLTDRIKEPDTTRWITRIYYPVF